MRHNRKDKRFNKPVGHLRCLMSNMTNSLLLEEKIRTTTPKAKELRRLTERMITLAKKGGLSDRRRAMAFLRNKRTIRKLFEEIGPRYASRPGGYTRIIKAGSRNGDSAPLSYIELVEDAS